MNICKRCGNKTHLRHYCQSCNGSQPKVVISKKEWFIYLLLTALPIFGPIWMIVTACGRGAKSVVSYARYTLVCCVLVLIMSAASVPATTKFYNTHEDTITAYVTAALQKMNFTIGENTAAGNDPVVAEPATEDITLSAEEETDPPSTVDDNIIEVDSSEEILVPDPPVTFDQATERVLTNLRMVYPELKASEFTDTGNYQTSTLEYNNLPGELRLYTSHETAKANAVGALLEHGLNKTGTAGDTFSFWYSDHPEKQNYLSTAVGSHSILLDLGTNSQGKAMQLVDILSSTEIQETATPTDTASRLSSLDTYVVFVNDTLSLDIVESSKVLDGSLTIETADGNVLSVSPYNEEYLAAVKESSVSMSSSNEAWVAEGDNYFLLAQTDIFGKHILVFEDASQVVTNLPTDSIDSAKQMGTSLAMAAGVTRVNWQNTVPLQVEPASEFLPVDSSQSESEATEITETTTPTETLPTEPASQEAPPTESESEKLNRLYALVSELPVTFKSYGIDTIDTEPAVNNGAYRWRGYLKDGQVACYIMYASDASSIPVMFETDKALAARTGATIGTERSVDRFKVVTTTYPGAATYTSMYGDNFYCRFLLYPEEKRDIDTLVNDFAPVLAKFYETQSELSTEEES